MSVRNLNCVWYVLIAKGSSDLLEGEVDRGRGLEKLWYRGESKAQTAKIRRTGTNTKEVPGVTE